MIGRHVSGFGLTLVALFGVVLGSIALAEGSAGIRGTILDPLGKPIPGVQVTLDGREPVVTGEDGRFSIAVDPGEWEIQVSHPGYRPLRYTVTVGEAATDLELTLQPGISVKESVTVLGIRAGDDVPVTKRNLDREEIETLSYGQDVPALLQ